MNYLKQVLLRRQRVVKLWIKYELPNRRFDAEPPQIISDWAQTTRVALKQLRCTAGKQKATKTEHSLVCVCVYVCAAPGRGGGDGRSLVPPCVC